MRARRQETAVQDGEHSALFRAVDSSENISETGQWDGRIDTIAPEVTTKVVDETLELSATDAGSGEPLIEFFIGNANARAAWQSYDGPIELTDEVLSVSYRATDAAGNTSEAGVFEQAAPVDPSAPSTPVPATPAPGTSAQDGDLAATGAESVIGIGLVTVALLGMGTLMVLRRRRMS